MFTVLGEKNRSKIIHIIKSQLCKNQIKKKYWKEMHQRVYWSYLIVPILVIIVLWLFSKIPVMMMMIRAIIIYGVFTI